MESRGGHRSSVIAPRADARDQWLVERHQSGDEAAFTELYGIHYPRLVRFCQRHLRDAHLAEEIAQDAFLRAFLSMGRLKGERRFYPWLTVIAKRLIVDYVRTHGRVRPAARIEQGAVIGADEVVLRRQDRRHVHAALDRMLERHREVLRLRDFEELSYDEIAERLGLPVTAIPPLLHRARAALRREFALVSQGRVAAFLHLPGVLAVLRRARMRAGRAMTWVPDSAVFSPPMARAMIGISALMVAAVGLETDDAVTPPSEGQRGVQSATATNSELPANDGPVDLQADQRNASQGSGATSSTVAVGGLAEAHLVPDREGAEGMRRRERSRNRPIHLEAGPWGITSDPVEDTRRLQEMANGAIP